MTNKENNDSLLVNQYQNLWDNIQQTNSHNFTLIIGIIAASGAILTAAFTNLKELKEAKIDSAIIGCIFISIYVITVPGQLLLNSNRRHIWLLSTYIQVFLEPHLKFLKWETNIARKNMLEKGKLLSDVIGNEFFIILVINLTATIAACCFFYFSSYLSAAFKVLLIILAALCCICFSLFSGVMMKRLKRGGEIEKENYDAWMKVKDMDVN